eukprot:2641561-Prymnesium_polylepis.2
MGDLECRLLPHVDAHEGMDGHCHARLQSSERRRCLWRAGPKLGVRLTLQDVDTESELLPEERKRPEREAATSTHHIAIQRFISLQHV